MQLQLLQRSSSQEDTLSTKFSIQTESGLRNHQTNLTDIKSADAGPPLNGSAGDGYLDLPRVGWLSSPLGDVRLTALNYLFIHSLHASSGLNSNLAVWLIW